MRCHVWPPSAAAAAALPAARVALHALSSLLLLPLPLRPCFCSCDLLCEPQLLPAATRHQMLLLQQVHG
jgi:hypothetical protein